MVEKRKWKCLRCGRKFILKLRECPNCRERGILRPIFPREGYYDGRWECMRCGERFTVPSLVPLRPQKTRTTANYRPLPPFMCENPDCGATNSFRIVSIKFHKYPKPRMM